MTRISGEENLSKAYETGICRDCEAKIEPRGPSSRCEVCEEQFSAYVESGWGLEKLIRERNRNQFLGLCFFCGTGLDGSDERLCVECHWRLENSQWRNGMYQKSLQFVGDKNPYVSVWDNNDMDKSVHLGPTLETMAQRILSRAKFFQTKAERGGPRGREYLEEARTYLRIAHKLLEKDKKVRFNSK